MAYCKSNEINIIDNFLYQSNLDLSRLPINHDEKYRP